MDEHEASVPIVGERRLVKHADQQAGVWRKIKFGCAHAFISGPRGRHPRRGTFGQYVSDSSHHCSHSALDRMTQFVLMRQIERRNDLPLQVDQHGEMNSEKANSVHEFTFRADENLSLALRCPITGGFLVARERPLSSS